MNVICSCNDIADEMPILSNTHPLTVYSPTHSIFTHSLYIHPLTLCSPTRCILTYSLHINLLTLYSPIHAICGLPNSLS